VTTEYVFVFLSSSYTFSSACSARSTISPVVSLAVNHAVALDGGRAHDPVTGGSADDELDDSAERALEAHLRALPASDVGEDSRGRGRCQRHPPDGEASMVHGIEMAG
jgi:hypothetical protein